MADTHSEKSYKNKIWALGFIGIYLSIVSPLSHGAGSRADYDLDDDGLIELYDIEDFLALESIYYQGGAKLYGDSTGCANDLCLGYELEADIDLTELPFTSGLGRLYFIGQIFEGNHHKLIGAKMIGRGDAGIFHTFNESVARNLVLEQVDFSASQDYVGGLTAVAHDSQFINVSVSGNLTSVHYTGGIVGVGMNINLVNCHFNGKLNPIYVQTTNGLGGLVGFADRVSIYASSATAQIISDVAPVNFAAVGGLVGVPNRSVTVSASYADVSNLLDNNVAGIVPYSMATKITDSYVIARNTQGEVQRIIVFDHMLESGLKDLIDPSNREIQLTDLTCPQSEHDSSCAMANLFSGWDRHQDSGGQSVWNWGSASEAPRHRTDLQFDATDSDSDGALDVEDDFPFQAAARLDTDQDGLPDRWNDDCDEECRSASNLRLDDRIERAQVVEGEPQVTAGVFNLWVLCMLGFCGFRLRNRTVWRS